MNTRRDEPLAHFMAHSSVIGSSERRAVERLNVDPDDLDSLVELGKHSLAVQRPDLGMALLTRAVLVDPASARAHYHLGNCHQALKALAPALASYDRAILLQPDYAAAYSRRSGVLLKQRSYSAALASALRATTLDAGSAQAWAGLGRIFGKLRQHALAARAYRKALAIDPEFPFQKGRLLQQLVIACDWSGLDALVAEISADLAAGRPSARPFVWQAVATSAHSVQLCAERFGYPAAAVPASVPRDAARRDDRIRIGYVSGEFREHSVSYLRAGVFEHHDRSRFDLTAFDNGWDDGGAARQRINAAMDRIIDIRSLSDGDAAAAIARLGIDVLVDLNGYNGANRQGVFAHRPAPVQTSFGAYPATLGVPYMDYILADSVVVPNDQFRFYTEQPVHMPDSYQPNDRNKPIADRRFERAELGLAEHAFVFCCFNNTYKIMPAMFDVWGRILTAVEGSILWLLADNPTAVANLRKEAAARGVDPARLVFAERMPMAEHLARHRCADLFLDTLPCNAHTTASDALWSGLPVLTCIGETFAGRVAASLLKAIDLPELICATPAEYEATAIRLATNPGELTRLKDRLATNRLTTPLFDTAAYTQSLETAFTMMHERRLAGLSPIPIVVPG